MPFSLRKLTRGQIVAFALLVVVAVSALGFGSQRWFKPASATKAAAPLLAQAKKKVNPLGKGYLQRRGIWPQLQPALDAYGDRWEKPGRERLTLIGTLTSGDQAEKIPTQLIFEFPDKVRLEKQIDNKLHVTIFDGKKKFKLGDALKREEEEELESLALDSADHFLAGHMQGFAMRYLGARFRLDDGTTPDYKGPYYDIYQMTDQIPTSKDEFLPQNKRYYVNSDSQLIERVSYQINRNGVPVNVLVQYSGWQKANGQQVPGTITRSENGKSTSVLTISTVRLSTRADDGIFTIPQNK